MHKFFLIGIASLLIVIHGVTGVHVQKAEAADLTQQLLYATVATAYVSNYYSQLNEKGQSQQLTSTQERTGVDEDEHANFRLKSIEEKFMSSGKIKNKYEVYINPKSGLNAFCTIGHVISLNKGLFELSDDEAAFTLGHELAHGEFNHPVKGVTKTVGLNSIVQVYLNRNGGQTSSVLANATPNYINGEMFTMAQEWDADNIGFEYSTAAGFNPGAGAASMIKIRTIYGEIWNEGLSRIAKPNDHPKTSDRIKNYSNKMTAYSNNHVKVKNEKTVQIDGKDVVSPVESGSYLAQRRAFLVAGNLTRVYHDNKLEAATVNEEDGTVYIGSQKIMTPANGDLSAQEIADRINIATGL